jgi:hypothetical protein
MPSNTGAEYPPLMRDQISALRDYARKHGPDGKEHLRKEWVNILAHPLLQRLRNTHGPFWLTQFELPK